MKKRDFPNISGVQFRSIPKSVINLESEFEHPLEAYSEDLFCCYTITNKKEVWFSNGGAWEKVKFSQNHLGETTVVLKYYGMPCQTIVRLESLYKCVFNQQKRFG